LACIKPPVTSSSGSAVIIGVTRPVFAAGPTVAPASVASAAPPSQPSTRRGRSQPKKAGHDLGAAADRAERAVGEAQALSLEQIGDAKKEAQRSLTAARAASAPAAEIARLESAVKDLQRAEAAKRRERAAQERLTTEASVQGSSRWIADYLDRTGGHREVVEVIVDGFTYLYDATTAPAAADAANRVVAVHGRSGDAHGPRDAARMRGYPNPNRVDRGHLVARAIGGGYDLNLIPQDPALNRGHSEPGKVWRELETYLANNPNSEFFVRPTYEDNSDYPTQIEFGVQLANSEWRIETFDNRPERTDEDRT
jgi:hypothetical protein